MRPSRLTCIGADRYAQREFALTRGWIVLFVRHRRSVARPVGRTPVKTSPGGSAGTARPATVSAAREPGQLRQLRLPIGAANTSRLLAGGIAPGGRREPGGAGGGPRGPVGEGGEEVAELVRSLDEERLVERREQRG